MATSSSAQIGVVSEVATPSAALEAGVDSTLPQIDVHQASTSPGTEEIQTQTVAAAGEYFSLAAENSRWSVDFRNDVSRIGAAIDQTIDDSGAQGDSQEWRKQVQAAVKEINRCTLDTQNYVMFPLGTESQIAEAKTKRDELVAKLDACDQHCQALMEGLLHVGIDPVTGSEIADLVGKLSEHVKALHESVEDGAYTNPPKDLSTDDAMTLNSRLNSIYKIDRELVVRAETLKNQAKDLGDQPKLQAALTEVLPDLRRGALFAKIASIDRLAESHTDFDRVEGEDGISYRAMNHNDAVGYAGRIDGIAAKLRATAKQFRDVPEINDGLLKFTQKLVDPLAGLITEARENAASAAAEAKAKPPVRAEKPQPRPAAQEPKGEEPSQSRAPIRAELLKALSLEHHPSAKMYLAKFVSEPRDGSAEVLLQDGRKFALSSKDYCGPNIHGKEIELARSKSGPHKPSRDEAIYVALEGEKDKRVVGWTYAQMVDVMWKRMH